MVKTGEQQATTLERALRIRGGERALVGWLVTLFMVIQASHGLGANAADTLFFQRYGVEQLPLMILISGPAVMLSVLAHGSGLAYRGAGHWLPTITLACGIWAGVEWAGAIFDANAMYPVIWISTQILMMVTLTVMWNAAGASCTTRQAKRLFPIFATAGVAGGVLGNAATGPLANAFGTSNLLVVQAGLLFTGSLLLLRVRSLFDDSEDEHSQSVLGGISETWEAIRSSRFLGLSAAIAVAIFCLFYLVYFPFSETVAASFATEAGTASFLGVFSSIATAATFFFSLLVTNRLFARLGLVITLMIVPAVYAAGFATWLVVFNLPSAAIVRGLQWIMVNAVALTAYNALFNVLPRRKRGEVVAFMTAVPAQVGVSLAGLLLIVMASAPTRAIFVVGLAIAVATVGAVVILRKDYLDAVMDAVRRGVIGLFDTPSNAVVSPSDGDVLRVLEDRLNDPRPRARALAAEGLGRLSTAADAAGLEPLLSDSDPRVRSAAFDSLCEIEPHRITSHAAAAIVDEVPEVRLQVLHYLAAHPEQNGYPTARAALDDPDVRVRAAAAIVVGGEEGERVVNELLVSDEPRAVTAVLTESSGDSSNVVVDPTPYLHHASPRVRSTAAIAYGRRRLEPQALRPGLDDSSSRVRRASARALAMSPQGREILMTVLQSGSVSASEAALEALTPVDELFEEFTDWARQEAKRAASLISYADAVTIDDPPRTLRYLTSVLEMRGRRLVRWVLLAMTTKKTRRVMPLVSRGVESSDPETRSQAIEALETIGARSVLAVLLPLLEPEGPSQKSNIEEALSSLARDFDPWLSALAARGLEELHPSGIDNPTLPSLSTMTQGERQTILDAMDRVLALQVVHMFSELDPEDLELIARATTEKTYEPGEAIFVQGEAGNEMLVIVEGSVVVSVDDGAARRVVETYGKGNHVGELSLLAGGPRSAYVHAGDDGVRGLALSAHDLMTVLDERPAVAVGMLGTLARRIIDQT